MESKRSLTLRLTAGLLFSIAALAVYAGYTATQLSVLRSLQTGIIDRNRRDSLLLVRVQNDFNLLGLAMRDMLDSKEAYPLTAWRSQFQRIRTDLDDAFAREAQVAPSSRTPGQSRFVAASVAQFWAALDSIFTLAERNEPEARTQVRLSLEARQAAISTAVSRLLVQNNESEEQAFIRTRAIHQQVERNLYVFLAAMLCLIAAAGIYLIHYNRRIFEQVQTLSERRSELAQQLISMQENTFRSISRELHDDFGQILTAIGAMLQRGHRLISTNPGALREELREVQEVVQSTLEKVRSLSQALHPLMLEEVGFENSLATYLPIFERRTGITVEFSKSGIETTLPPEASTHLYRVLQEALNNVVRHSGSSSATVRLVNESRSLTLEVEDQGHGFQNRSRAGLGLISMRERIEMVGGRIEFVDGASGGALVRAIVPVAPEPAKAEHAAH